MLSRVANTIFWMSRYVERAENVSRVVDVTLQLMLDLPIASASNQWEAVVQTTGDQPLFRDLYGEPNGDSVIRFLTFDRRNPNSILSCLGAARENARMVRDVITNDMWEQLNTFYLLVQNAARADEPYDMPHEFFAEVRSASHRFLGATDATMSHDEAWHFCRLGRMIERADKTTRILDVKYFLLLPEVGDVGTSIDDLQWTAVLHSASAMQMYRRRYGQVTPERVIDFLLLNREFPRAVHFCLVAADNSLHAIGGTPIGTFRNSAERCVGQLRSELAYSDVKTIIHAGMHEVLDRLQSRLNDLGHEIHESFFSPTLLKGSPRPAAAVQTQ